MTGGGTSTTVTPSTIDLEKADTAKLMKMFLMGNMEGGIKGQPTPMQNTALQNLLQQSRHYSARMGINPGEPLLRDAERMSKEQLTMPNKDALSRALQMYGYTANVPGGVGRKETEQHTNLWDYVGAIASLVGAASGGG